MTAAWTTDPTEAKPVAYGVVTRGDGREVGWTAWGAADGPIVVAQPHGGASGRRALAVDMVPFVTSGIRLVFVARAGLGPSSRRPGRTAETDAEDTLAILDAMGIDRAHLLGECGGTGAILALAARHPDRVRAIALVSGMAALIGPDAASYVAPRLRSIGRWLRYAPVARWMARQATARFNRDPIAGVDAAVKGLPAPDRLYADDPVRRSFAISLNSEFMSSPQRYLDEWRSIAGPWTFDLAAIRAPVLIDHGALDTAAPVAMARWLARHIPTAELRIDHDRGHLLAPERLAGVLTELVASGL